MAERRKRHVYRIEWEREQQNTKFINFHMNRMPNIRLPRVGRPQFNLPRRPLDMLNYLYPVPVHQQDKDKIKDKSETINDDLKDLHEEEKGSEDQTKPDVTFDANFETGNMESAYCSSKQVYDIWLRGDSTGKGLLWFNFRMRNHNKFKGKIRVRIVNLATDKNLL